jgi:hypothetical protein
MTAGSQREQERDRVVLSRVRINDSRALGSVRRHTARQFLFLPDSRQSTGWLYREN